MAKTKSRRSTKPDAGKDTKEARLSAAQCFVKGDRVRSRTTGKLGSFVGINLGFALPETWVVFDSDTDSRIPISCNPLDLELAQKDCAEHRVLRELGMLGDTQLSLLSQTELHIESDEQASDETPALVDEAAVTLEQLAAEANDPKLQAGSQTIAQEESDMAATVDDTPQADVEVVEELTEEELADRHRLELKVERAFFEAGVALRELRDRRLYRSSHKTFEEYCQDRFGYSRISAYHKITAAEVVENLLTKSYQNRSEEAEENLLTKSYQILPTKETQVRPLAKLNPEEQRSVWQRSVEAAGGKVPTERLVKAEVLRHKGIVERIKEKNPQPPEFTVGDVCEIRAGKHSPLRRFDGMWGIIEHVGSFSYTVRISIARDLQQCREEEMAKIDAEYIKDITLIAKRIEFVVQNFDLEPIEYDILENLQRSRCFTPKQLRYLEMIEREYKIESESEN